MLQRHIAELGSQFMSIQYVTETHSRVGVTVHVNSICYRDTLQSWGHSSCQFSMLQRHMAELGSQFMSIQYVTETHSRVGVTVHVNSVCY